MKVIYLIISIFIVLLSINSAQAKSKTHPRKVSKVHKVSKLSPKAPKVAAVLYGSNALTTEINHIINTDGQGADVAVYVKSLKLNDSIYQDNVNRTMTPASTMKVLTAEAGLLFLKPSYRFSTQLLTDAKSIKNGVLQGNLYLVLSGDPTLTYNDLMVLFSHLKSHQISAISGNVYIDNNAYDQSFYGPGWEWQDKVYCYAAPISASIINHNCLSFKLAPSTVGHKAKLVTSSKYFYPAIKNDVLTKAKSAHACGLHLSSDTGSDIAIDGCIPKGKEGWGVTYVVKSIPDYDRALVKALLQHLGVGIYGDVTFKSAPENLSLIGQHPSEALQVLVKEMLKKSDNVIAGALFKKIGQLYTREPGTWQNGGLAVSKILSKEAGVNTYGMRLLDGSGLSPYNRVTPAQLMQTLDFTYHNPETSDAFIAALPIAGVDGTLKHRMGNIARKVRAKTGTISGVVSLAGYAVTADQETVAFVIMVNGSKGLSWRYKEMEDKIATALTRYRREG